MQPRKDSKSIAILAIFSSIIIALEVFPLPGITDIVMLPSPRFTIDWSGIPLIMIFVGLGFLSSLIGTVIMVIAIFAHGNYAGGIFKGFAELFTIVGLAVGYYLMRKRDVSNSIRWGVYLILGILFRAVGMFFTNIMLLPILYFYDFNAAVIASAILVPFNILQAVINILGGLVFYNLIPESLKVSAGLGEFYEPSRTIRELPVDEIEETDTREENEYSAD